MQLNTYLESKRDIVNQALNKIINVDKDFSKVVSAMNYSLFAGGKRIRPILCIASAEAFNGKKDIDSAIFVGCAIEMIHTYSLIHDDLPAMDNDDMRRGEPACHIAFDEATAILAGDGLLTAAFQLLSSPELIKTSDKTLVIKLINIISAASGYKGMVHGQMLDISAEREELSLNEMEKMHYAKTGEMINAALCCGAYIGNAKQWQIKLIKQFGYYIGLAFQATDDILNVDGDPKVMGKAIKTDNLKNKATYPSILGLEHSKDHANQLLEKALKSIEFLEHKGDPLRSIARYIVSRKK